MDRGLSQHTPPPDCHRRFGPRVRNIALTVGLAGGIVAMGSSPATVVALDFPLSGPASSVSQGLQVAERLTPIVEPGQRLEADLQSILDTVNAERAARGIAPVAYHPQLAQAARAHAADQYNKNCLTSLSHTGTDGSNTGHRIARTGLSVRTWGENIACNQQSAAQVMSAWMNSSGHRTNILNSSFTHIGISATLDSRGHRYWVQVFGTPR